MRDLGGRGRRTRGLLAACTVLGVASAWIGSTVVSAAPGQGDGPGATEPGPIVTVRHSPAPWSAECASGIESVGYETVVRPSSFTLRIVTTRPRCAPVRATAAAYRMPDDNTTWPQQLVDTAPVVLAGAGVTEVSFARTCVPMQFDVVTGDTPDTIAPWAAWHGPLLFPLDTRTAFQDRGTSCGPDTTAAPGTAVPSTIAPSSDGPPPVAPSTTAPVTVPPVEVPGGGDDDEVEVLAVTSVPSTPAAQDPTEGAPAAPSVAGLALTGTTAAILVVSGTLLLIFGAGFVIGSWLRARAEGDVLQPEA